MALISILMFFFFLPCAVLSASYSHFSKILLPPTVTGPETAAFNQKGEGPFVCVADGRILKWKGAKVGFGDFAYTSKNRTKQRCDGTTDPNLGPICGRPLALSFYLKTDELYIADAYLGLLVVGPAGGLATQLATGVGGVPFKFLCGVDVDQRTGYVYFSDASETFELRNRTQPNFKPDSTGRLMKYNPKNKEITVLLRGLGGGGGPAVSTNSRYLLVPEYDGRKVLMFWLTGRKANTAEIILNPGGNPNKIKRAGSDDFWVAVEGIDDRQPTLVSPKGLRISAFGKVLESVSFADQYFNKTISVIQQRNEKLYIGSRFVDFIGVYQH